MTQWHNTEECRNVFWTKRTVFARSRGCCTVYQRTRLLSKRQIVALCQSASACWPSLFIWLLPWLRLDSPDVRNFSVLWQRHSLQWHIQFHQDRAGHENAGVKHATATSAEQGATWCFEVLFSGRLSAEGEDKSLDWFLTWCMHRKKEHSNTKIEYEIKVNSATLFQV